MYFEDFNIGQKFVLEPITFTLEDIREFAGKYDPLPIHVDLDFARSSNFEGIIASGFHTLCAVWGQWIALDKTGKDTICGICMDYLNWKAPVFPNDEIKGEVEVVDLIPSSKGGRGILVIKVTAYNQKEQIVLDTQVRGFMKSKNV
jgi:acyl dehydratase